MEIEEIGIATLGAGIIVALLGIGGSLRMPYRKGLKWGMGIGFILFIAGSTMMSL